MPKLIILYGPPDDPAAFEDYYSARHIPYASEHMPGATGAENLRVVGTPARPRSPTWPTSPPAALPSSSPMAVLRASCQRLSARPDLA